MSRSSITYSTNHRPQPALHDAGFKLHAQSEQDYREQASSRDLEKEVRLLILAVLSCIPFMVQMIAQFLDWEEVHMMPVAELVLATFLQVVVGARFYRSAFAALRNRYAQHGCIGCAWYNFGIPLQLVFDGESR